MSTPRDHCLWHFYTRVRERIGLHVEPHVLADKIIEVIGEGGHDPCLTFVTRCDGPGKQRRVWRLTLGDQRHFIIFDHALNVPVTVLPPTACIKRCRGTRVRHLYLENYL